MRRDVIGVWTIGRRLGGGGNGDVWAASRPGDPGRYAMKVLRQSADDRLARFRAEVEFLLKSADRPGVLPIVDSDLNPQNGRPWYVMPAATPILKALGNDPSPGAVVQAMTAIAATLASLAADGVGHRDVKPDNLFRLGDEWVVGDFGLVKYPDKEPMTRHGRKLGPLDYMAPEMRIDADRAATEPADVWSFAKSLWVLLLDEDVPLPGPHRMDDEAYALVYRLNYEHAFALDLLLAGATKVDPTARVEMAYMAKELEACLLSRRADASSPALQAFSDLISTKTAPSYLKAEELAEKRRRANNAFSDLKEALSVAYHSLAPHLQHFSSGYGGNTDAVNLPLPEFTPFVTHRWGGHFAFDGERAVRVRVNLGIGMNVLRPDSVAQVRAGLQVQVSVDDRWSVPFRWDFDGEAHPGSAQFANVVSEVANGFTDAFKDVLQTVADALR